jgi:hypothetical protein
MACHGIFGSNVVTDFGWGSANFSPAGVATPTFFNPENAYGNNRNAWQLATISGGSIYVPTATVPASDLNPMIGVNQSMSIEAMLQLPNLNGSAAPAVSAANVTPPAGQPMIIQTSQMTITYPSESEILNLVPSALQADPVAFSTVTVPGVTNVQISGLSIDSSGLFVRNGSDPVICYGDVVIKGTLFLNNVDIQTDAYGCRLYVAGTVFIQGTINYLNNTAANENLQISSSRGILMGFSTKQMGAAPANSGKIRIVNAGDNIITNPGGNFARFAQVYDLEFDPSYGLVNGVAPATFFNQIVSDGLKIGAELLDAGDKAAIDNPPPGATVTNAAEDEGGRLSINYEGLLLNAPHIHSRYAGSFQGVVIGEVAMLARNPSTTTTIEQYSYDPIFNSAPAILPALSTDVLVVK